MNIRDSMKVLVVDDSKVVTRLVSEMLIGTGHEVSCAEDGLVGIKVTEETGPFDITLLDWNMPNMNGVEFLEAVNFELAGNVIMMTTESGIDKMKEALSKGASEYIMKPFSEEILFEKLELFKK